MTSLYGAAPFQRVMQAFVGSWSFPLKSGLLIMGVMVARESMQGRAGCGIGVERWGAPCRGWAGDVLRRAIARASIPFSFVAPCRYFI